MEKNNSLSGIVFSSLKSAIISGEYPNGAELRENVIAQKLGVSRTPVREALRQLEKEGLVEIYPNRRTHVKGITFKDVEDIYLIRARLEGLCAQMAVKCATQQQLDQLDEIILLSKYYMNKDDTDHLMMMDGQFHEVLYASCQSKILENQLKDYHQYVKMARLHSLQKQGRSSKSVEEHEEILKAIHDKDALLADQLATQHILNAMENIRSSI